MIHAVNQFGDTNTAKVLMIIVAALAASVPRVSPIRINGWVDDEP